MPLAKGLLSGKYNSNHKFNDSDVRSKSKDLNKNIIDKGKLYTYQSALSWSSENVDEVIIGSKNIIQLNQNNEVINRI